MFEILTVCTGNICRSPLAEVLLRKRLEGLDVKVHSAGTQGLDHARMTSDAQALAAELGADVEAAAAHYSRWLTEADLQSPDLIIALTREHRRKIMDMAPARMRRTFTAREFAHLAEALSDQEIADAAALGGTDQTARLKAAVAVIADMRGRVPAPADPDAYDVVDPYRRSWATYQRSAAEMMPGINQIERVLKLAAG